MTSCKSFLGVILCLVLGAEEAMAELVIAGINVDLGMSKAAVLRQCNERDVTLEALKGLSDTFCIRTKEKPCNGLLTFREDKLEIASLYWRTLEEQNTAPELATLLIALVVQCSKGRSGSAQISLDTIHSEVGRFEAVRLQYGDLNCELQLVEQPDGRRYVKIIQTISSRR